MATLYESYIINDDTRFAFYATIGWNAQTFTSSVSHIISSVKLRLLREAGATGTVTISIQGVDGSGDPDSTDLCSGTLAVSGITTSSAGAFYEITFSTTALIVAGTVYAIVAKSSTDDTNNPVYWRFDTTGATYTGGSRFRTDDQGATWASQSGDDFMFEEWGDPQGSSGGGAIYPTDPLLRVSGIRRTFWAGLGGQSVYQVELALGGISTSYVSPIGSRDIPSAVTPTTPSGMGYQETDYLAWLKQTDLMDILKLFGHFPTYADWVKWKQTPYFPKYF